MYGASEPRSERGKPVWKSCGMRPDPTTAHVPVKICALCPARGLTPPPCSTLPRPCPDPSLPTPLRYALQPENLPPLPHPGSPLHLAPPHSLSSLPPLLSRPPLVPCRLRRARLISLRPARHHPFILHELNLSGTGRRDRPSFLHSFSLAPIFPMFSSCLAARRAAWHPATPAWQGRDWRARPVHT